MGSIIESAKAKKAAKRRAMGKLVQVRMHEDLYERGMKALAKAGLTWGEFVREAIEKEYAKSPKKV